jgi:predicted O-methyltransferase YrrM
MIKRVARTILPTGIWNQVRKLKPLPVRFFQVSLARIGYNVARLKDYYSPLPSVPQLKKNIARWNRPSALTGISYDLERMKTDLADLLSQYYREFAAFPPFEGLKKAGYGPGYTAVDALTLYMLIRHIKPKRYFEVGSGLSTYYCSLAAASNTQEGHPLEITCIEPNPFEKLFNIPGIQVITKEVQDVEPSFFQGLQQDDVLFIDSSHVLKIDGDVPYLYLEILPNLNVGVVIHIHDVHFPYNTPYPPEHRIFENPWPRLWTEAMVVQAFLIFNPDYRILMSTPLLRFHDEPFLKEHIPLYETVDQNPDTFSSLWLRRVA